MVAPGVSPGALVVTREQAPKGRQKLPARWGSNTNPLSPASRAKNSFLSVSPGLRPGLFSSALFEGSLN